jgi:hypothetical protein
MYFGPNSRVNHSKTTTANKAVGMNIVKKAEHTSPILAAMG